MNALDAYAVRSGRALGEAGTINEADEIVTIRETLEAILLELQAITALLTQIEVNTG